MSKGGNNFEKVLSLTDEYDRKLAEVVSVYDDAMISLSHLKFNNPYCPITTRGFQITPALKQVTP